MDCRDGAVLITGASGFIGRHITRRLLRNGRSLVVLMRARGQNAQERLQRALGTKIAGRPLRIVTADLSKPDLGLDSTPLWRLAGPIETVVHCAGDTTFFPRDIAASRAVCIDGPLALLASLRPGGLRRWVQISTAHICGQRSGTVFEHERDVGQSFHNPYERLKLLAEIAVERRCGELDVDLRVARPSIVVGPPCGTPGSRPSNLFFEFIDMLSAIAHRRHSSAVSLRIPARPGAPFNIVPVDYVSASVETLIGHPGASGGTFHIVLADPPTREVVLHKIASRLGLEGARLYDAAVETPVALSSLESRIARMLSPYRAYLHQHVKIDDRHARRLLHHLQPRSTSMTLDDLIDRAVVDDQLTGASRTASR